MTIYCVARSASSLRFAPETKAHIDQRFLKENQMFSLACNRYSKDLPHVTAAKLVDNGRKLVAELIQLNTQESLQENELFKRLFLSKPQEVLLGVGELVQERIKEVVSNNALVSSIAEATDYFTATTKALMSDVGDLSQLFNEKKDHALASATEFWKTYCENHTPLETLHCLVDDFVLSHISCEGLELFSEYVWAMRPQYGEPGFIIEANLPLVDDDAFHFHFMDQDRIRRRSILFVGQR